MANVDDGNAPEEPKVTPNIEAIAKLIAINGPIHRAEEAGQDSRSNLGNYYKKIQDDLHGHRGAAKLVRQLLNKSATARADFMRTFEPLAEHFNLFPSQGDGDLVDNAERQTAAEKRGGDGNGGGESTETKTSGQTALENARNHLSGGTKPADPPAKASGKPKLGIVAPTEGERPH